MTRSMKAVLTGFFIVCLFNLSVQAAPPSPASQAVPSQTVPRPPVGKPDLVVVLNLVTEQYTDQDAGGITCYNVTPQYTVTNAGQAIAAGFRIKLEWKPGPGADWQLWGFLPNQRLNPGQSFHQGPSPAARTKWCAGYGYNAVGFRVTADDETKVTESNEENNTATRLFPSLGHNLPGLKPELIQKKTN